MTDCAVCGCESGTAVCDDCKFYENSEPALVHEDWLFIGDVAAPQRRHLRAHQITHVVSLFPFAYWSAPDVEFLSLDLLDTPYARIDDALRMAIDFIDGARARNGRVLVHCYAGISRSSTMIIGYLMGKHGMSFDAALAHVRRAWPRASPNTGFANQLEQIQRNPPLKTKTQDC